MRPRLTPGIFSTIYWPVETKVRELDGALLFSVVAAQRGWSVIVGGKTELYRGLRQNAEPGILVDKSIQKRSEHLFRVFKKRGHRVFARCEEGLWFATPEDYCNRKTGGDAFAEVDGFLAWGREHAHALAQVYPQFAHKVVAPGNVRCDLMSPAVRGVYDREVSEIRKKWGEFVLLNTKLAKVNNFRKGFAVVERHIAMGHAPTEEQVRITSKRVALEKAVLPHVVEFVERFSKQFPGEQLIIRPHPAEDHSFWEGIAAGKANVDVVHQGNVNPWVLASKLSISSDCTTSLEAYLLDKPGINFRPVKDEEVEWTLPKVTAYQVESTDELLRVLALSDPLSALSLPDAPTAEIVGKCVAQCGGTLASTAILDYFADLYAPREDSNGAGYNPLGKPDLAFVALQRLKVFVAWCSSKKMRERQRNRQNKIRGLGLGEIASRVDQICTTLGYKSVRVKTAGENMFHIDRSM